MRAEDMRDIYREHRAIYKAIRKGEPDLAVEMTAVHFRNARSRVSLEPESDDSVFAA